MEEGRNRGTVGWGGGIGKEIEGRKAVRERGRIKNDMREVREIGMGKLFKVKNYFNIY